MIGNSGHSYSERVKTIKNDGAFTKALQNCIAVVQADQNNQSLCSNTSKPVTF
jgi:hypothetical protein